MSVYAQRASLSLSLSLSLPINLLTPNVRFLSVVVVLTQ